MESYQVRAYIQKALELDLIGPNVNYPEYHDEILTQPPSKWYLGGFLVPFGAPVEIKSDPTADDNIDEIINKDISEEGNTPETSSARKVSFPSSIGLSFLIPADTQTLDITVIWGDYQPQEKEIEEKIESIENENENEQPPKQILWHRLPNSRTLSIALPENNDKIQIEVPESNGLKLFVSRRRVPYSPQLPIDTQSVSVFLVNHRFYHPNSNQDQSFIFQACVKVHTADIFVPRPDLRGENNLDQDQAIASLQYRDDCEYVVGHNISAEAKLEDHLCREISTTWIPAAEVPRVEPATIDGLELGMEALAQAADADTVRGMIGAIVTEYGNWISQHQNHAIDTLCTISYNSVDIRPKIIASTATVRRAEAQIQALFARQRVEIFPLPGPNRHDSFFAITIPITDTPGRLYVGVAAQGRSLKVVLLRAYLALLGAAQKAWLDSGAKKNLHNPADPYMTLLGYFNSLRELGGSRRLVEDEVNSRLIKYGERRRYGETVGLFANRKIDDEPTELTSRVSTNQVAQTKRRLSLPFQEREKVDVALATNMISVGLDITSLGLMVVLGQPKTAAEYIQATSRVGRQAEKPGLVITLLNIHRPRDRSHYERFPLWHNTFYRAVEATSVTPFSPRALDRGLAGVTVALSRLGKTEMTPPIAASNINQYRSELDFVVQGIPPERFAIAQRAAAHSPTAHPQFVQDIEKAVINLLDTWEKIASQDQRLQYQREVEIFSPLLLDPHDPQTEKETPTRQKFKAQRSLRDVEPVVKLKICDSDGLELEK